MEDQNAVGVHDLPGRDALLTNYSNVYEYTPEKTMRVKTGDFIGIILPPISARLLLSFVRNSGPSGDVVEIPGDVEPVSGREGDLPLITLEISKNIVTFHV